MKEAISDDDNDDLDVDKEEKDLEIVNEFYQCPTGSIVTSALDTLSIFGMFNDVYVKNNVTALTSKKETLLINPGKQINIKHYFTPL